MTILEESLTRDHLAVTPSDTTVYGNSASSRRPFAALWIGTAGNVVIQSPMGNSATFAVAANSKLEVAGNMVKATGTTAGGIVALFY